MINNNLNKILNPSKIIFKSNILFIAINQIFINKFIKINYIRYNQPLSTMPAPEKVPGDNNK